MKSHTLKNRRGTTLVELIVCAALLGIFCLAVVSLMKPLANVFTRTQQLNHAQSIADSVSEDLRALVLHARGPVRLARSDEPRADPADTPGDWRQVFTTKGGTDPANAIEFMDEKGYAVVIDAGSVPETTKQDALTGTPHVRYFEPTSAGARLQYAFDEGQCAAYADLHGDKFYMGSTVRLKFEGIPGAGGTGHYQALDLTVEICDEGGQVIYTKNAVLDLAEHPAAATE